YYPNHKGCVKMKLCLIGWGDSIHMQRWIRWFVDNGDEVSLITDRPSNMDGVTEYDISGEGGGGGGGAGKFKVQLFRNILAVRKIVGKINPDVLHLHTLLYPSYLGVFSGFRPLVVTPWNGDIVWKSQWSRLRKYAVKRGLAKADFITVDSEELREKTLRYGAYDSKIEYISFGVDTEVFRPRPGSSELRARQRIEPGAPVIFSNRSFEDLYNIDIIIKAVPAVLEVFPNAIFLFAWHSASKKESLVALAESLGVTDSVRFVGKVGHDELAAYYNESDLFVTIPSGDTIAISLLEAMASGVVPVVSDLPSTRECIKDGVNGYIVPLRDAGATARAIINALESKDCRGEIAKRGRRWVTSNADWNTNMKKVEDIYCSLVR
ncbi:MAG: glycosyltransferase family 4 protein, partial [Thermodesulfobacteriota bacterium]